MACALEGFRFIGCEKEPEYVAIAHARIQHHQAPEPEDMTAPDW